MAGEVAAVDGRDVRRLEHRRSSQVVPVEEVSVEALASARASGIHSPPGRSCLERDEAEIDGAIRLRAAEGRCSWAKSDRETGSGSS